MKPSMHFDVCARILNYFVFDVENVMSESIWDAWLSFCAATDHEGAFDVRTLHGPCRNRHAEAHAHTPAGREIETHCDTLSRSE